MCVCVCVRVSVYLLWTWIHRNALLCIFLGNDYLHDITSQAHYTLRIDMGDVEGATRYAVYSRFAVASEGEKYKLSIGGYSGTSGN